MIWERIKRMFRQDSPSDTARHVIASSFADPADIEAFKKCKAEGKTDEECFKVGDNGIGAFGFDTAGHLPICALPPEDWQTKWGSRKAAAGKPVIVRHKDKSVVCLLGDTMPHRRHITNGCGIDLNPAACKALGLTPPVKAPVTWDWATC